MPNLSSDLTGDLPQIREAFATSWSHSHLAFMQQGISEPSQCPFIDIRFSKYPSELSFSHLLNLSLYILLPNNT